jgi:hypothetical protein
MKINGVAGKGHASLQKGDVIELSPEQKLISMAQEEFIKTSPENFKYLPVSTAVEGNVNVIRGREGVKNADAVQYQGIAVIKYRVLNLIKDRLYPEVKAKVKLHFVDAKDELGVADLKIVSFEVL